MLFISLFCRPHKLSYKVMLMSYVSAAPGQVGAEGERVGNQAAGLSATGG